MADYSQEGRALQIHTDLGEDALLLTALEGEEAVSRPFRFELEMASPLMEVDAASLLRTGARVTFPLQDGSERTIHGLFSRFAQTGRHEDLATYRGTLVAWPWMLSLRTNRRIFQEKTILAIAEEIFGDWGLGEFEFRCEDRPARDYVVQYNETDLNFLSRWLETEGIFYFFEHSRDGHLLVLADGNGAVQPCPGISEAWIRGRGLPESDVVTSLTREHAVHVARVTMGSYDYLQPSHSLEASLEGEGVGEIYEFPGSFSTREDGERYARYRLEAQEALREQVHGEGSCRWMLSGHSFDLKGHFSPDTDGTYFITSVTHRVRYGGLRSGETEEFVYANTFRCVRAEVPFRPLPVHEKPTLRGTQTAVVVGPEGEEIWTDRYGRVKAQFHWDREGQNDQDSSCWMRVSTPWGSKGFGSFTVPRIGDEVLVDFLEGDPDRPLIVGSVYNAERMPPFDLPAKKTQAGLRSHSIQGGREKFSEIRFDDKPGEERLIIHAERDHHVEVENNEFHSVGKTVRMDYGGVEIKVGHLGVGGGQDEDGPERKRYLNGYDANYGTLYKARAQEYDVAYGEAKGEYGTYQGHYGAYWGLYGNYQSMYLNNNSIYGIYVGLYSFAFSGYLNSYSLYGVKFDKKDVDLTSAGAKISANKTKIQNIITALRNSGICINT